MPFPPHYRRENLFLKALIVLAIIGAISVRKKEKRKELITKKMNKALKILLFI